MSEYTVGKAMDVQLKDGAMVRCKPGDALPDNAQFNNHEQWVRHGYLVPTKNFVPKLRGPTESVPARTSTAADIERAKPTPMPEKDALLSSIPGADNFVDAAPVKVKAEDLEALSRPELARLAADAGVKVERSMGKAQIVKALLDAQG